MYQEISWYVPKNSGTTMFAHTKYMVHWYTGTKNAKTRLVAYHLAPKYGPKTKHYLSRLTMKSITCTITCISRVTLSLSDNLHHNFYGESYARRLTIKFRNLRRNLRARSKKVKRQNALTRVVARVARPMRRAHERDGDDRRGILRARQAEAYSARGSGARALCDLLSAKTKAQTKRANRRPRRW